MSTYYIAGFPITDELYHHGIKGQRWGVRRFQNPDGTLTPSGKDRYNKGQDDKVVEERNRKIKKALIIGGSAVAAAALAYGTYRLAKANPEIVQYGQYKIKNLLNKNSNVERKADWTDKAGDDSLNRMAKAGFRDIEEKYSYVKDTSIESIMSRGSSDAFSEATRKSLDAINSNYGDRVKRSGEVISREHALSKERRQILDKQFKDTYNILKQEKKDLRRKRKAS